MSKASLELGGGNWAAKDNGDGTGSLLGYAVGDTSGKYLPREFTFSRGADIAATRVNKDGLIEKYRENALLNSGDFSIDGASGGWVKGNATVTSGYAGYDGTTNAWKLESTAETSFNSLYQEETDNAAITPLGSKVATFSVYLKAGTTNWVRLNLNGTGNVYFDLENGVVGTASSGVLGQIESEGNGFYRCSITRLSGLAFDACYIYLAESDGSILPNTHSTPEHIFIQHPQLEYGLVATDYLESGSTTGKAGVLDNLPRIDYTSGSAQLLMEPERKNLVPYSENLGNIAWNKTRCTIDDNDTISPEGVVNGAKMTSTDPSESYIQDVLTTTQTKVAWSFWAKKGDLDYVHGLLWDTSANGCRQWFNVSTGELGDATSFGSGYSVDSASIEEYGNGWWRCVMIVNCPVGDQGCRVNISDGNTFITSATNSYGYFYGLQLEDASYATSYIPNYGTALGVTRAAEGEDPDSLVTELPSELSGGYTLFMDFEVTGNEDPAANYQDLFDFKFDDALSKSAFRVETYNSGTPNYEDSIRGFAYKQSSSAAVASVNAGDIPFGSRVKLAVTFDDSYGVKMFYNGSKIKDYAEVTAYEKVKFIGGAGSSGNIRSRTLVNQILAYPTVLSETECENLTTI